MTPEELNQVISGLVRERNELAAQREAAERSEMAAEKYRRQLDERQLEERVALASASARSDPEGTARFLVRIAIELADRRELSQEVLDYLSEALIAAAKNPSDAGAAFGLVLKRGRKPRVTTHERRAEIANFMAAQAKEQGLPIRPTAHGQSAADLAAEKYLVSPDTARNA